LDMFWDLNGATRTPCARSHAPSAAVIQLLPAPEPHPRMEIAFIAATIIHERASRALGEFGHGRP